MPLPPAVGVGYSRRAAVAGYTVGMLILGLVLLVLGFLFGIPILWTIGIILALVGIVLLIVGASHPIGGRRYWY